MRRNISPARWSFTLLLLAGLFFGAAGQSLARVEAAPRAQAATNVVISEFRTRGPDGGNDEFVELFNPTNALVDISGWQIRASTASGSSTGNRYTMPGGTQIQSGQHYLIVGSTYSGTVPGEIGAQLSSGTADEGGLALTLSDGTTIIDQVGMSVATVYKEGIPLQPLTTDTNRSYERIMDATGSCVDANDNSLDYFIRSPSDPQNLASPINTCGDATPTPIPPTDTAVPDDNDLSLTMTVPASDLFPNVNDTVTFTIKVLNTGATTVTGITVKDVLPPGLTYKSDDGGGTYNKTTGIWVAGSLGAGATAQLKITATVTQQAGSISNEAEIWDADQVDPDSTPGNGNPLEDDYDKVTINSKIADLNITKTVTNATPNKGENILFTITVSNAGPDNAENVTVKDLLPADVTYIADDGGGSYNYATGIWAVGTLLASGIGSSDTLIITAQLITSEAKTNAAEVWTSDQYDPDSIPGNGETSEDDYASVVVTPTSADLSLTKTINNPIPNVGDAVTFTITVSNAGPSNATNVSVKDLLPSDFTYMSDDSGGSYNSVTGIWTVGTLANGASASLNINATAVVDGVGTNWAEVWTSDQSDPNSTPGDNSKTSDDDDGAPTADLSIVKSVNSTTVVVDSNVVFTVTVSNSGPGNASNVSVKDVLPSGLTYVSDTGAGAYNNVTGMWIVGSLSKSAKATLNITASAVSSGTITNWAEVWTSNQTDPNSTPGDGSTTTDDDASVAVTALLPTPTRTSLKTVVITEVAWMGTAASSSDEWIELYNSYNARVDLDGWRLRSYRYNGTDFVLNLDIDLTDHYIDPRTSIDPKNTSGYFLLEAGNDNTVSDITSDNSPGEGMIYQGSLYNSGEILLLCSTLSHCNINTKNQTVDYVNGSLTTTGTIKPWPAGSSSTYGSMERKNLISDEPTNYFTHTGANPKWGLDASGKAINGTPKHDNWAYNVTSTPRPTSTPTRTRTPLPNLNPVPLLVLNEFLVRAGTDWNNDGTVDTYDEFIEVINSGTVDVNLGGYKLDDYELDANGKLLWNGFTLPSQTLKPGEKAVFYGSETGILLNDSGDTVYLMRTSNNSVVDSYKYPVVKSVDVSICRYVDAYGSWLERCFPTPGQPNSLTGEQTPSTAGGSPAFVCLLSDSVPEEFVLAECEESGLGIWNRSYWDSLHGEGDEIWLPEESGKWPVIYQ
jgi:uncharacterized repeat protein (TIGR01451 family)